MDDLKKRKQIINELQAHAEKVLSLKEEHRQKRPIVIEFSGSPKAGKTSCINSLELFLKRNGFSVKVVQERASVCPVSDKQSPMFNLWTACASLAALIGTLENKNDNIDVLILDRGIFDAMCWFQWLVSTKRMESNQQKITEDFFLMEELIKTIDIVFAFCVNPEVSIEREYTKLLTDKPGTIMNKKILSEYLDAVRHTINYKRKYFHDVFEIDTSAKTQDDVGKEVTEKTLNSLKDLLMERVGYFKKTDKVGAIIDCQSVIKYEKLYKLIPPLEFNRRDYVEKDDTVLQPLPIAVITNEAKDKILVVKKNKNAVSNTSPEADKYLIYVGGHSRYEDKTCSNESDFLSICKTTLKREIKEEIGISVALDNITPFFIYSNTSKSAKHLALCFVIIIDEDSIKLRLDPHELVLNKGKSKSGKLVDISEIMTYDLESWSSLILKYCFNINKTEQISLFDA